ncbi:hypothetical protein J5N97_026954 [Dioscorea zingiberensis]|uniref:Uncharacterized protein n=1 Tax=Dioscorea zingiberensis TaxID=325984 RepID=A0A9D5C344_9LILI|nr:hypothetical protein J5N97_026954 [Dioscorea zingiberensis]
MGIGRAFWCLGGSPRSTCLIGSRTVVCKKSLFQEKVETTTSYVEVSMHILNLPGSTLVAAFVLPFLLLIHDHLLMALMVRGGCFQEVGIIDEASPSLLTRQLVSGDGGDHSIEIKGKFAAGENPELFEDSDSDSKQSEEGKRTWTKNVEEACCEQSLVIKDPVNTEELSPSSSWYSMVSGEGERIKLNGEHVSRLPSQSENSQKLSEYGTPSSSCLETESNVNSFHSVSVQDIYEVPEDQKRDEFNENFNRVLEDSILKAKNIFVPQAAMDYILKDDEWLNKALIYSHHENKIKSQLQKFERENAIIQEDADRGKEQLKLLKEIYKQLNVIESKIRVKKHAQEDDSKLVSVMELQ